MGDWTRPKAHYSRARALMWAFVLVVALGAEAVPALLVWLRT